MVFDVNEQYKAENFCKSYIVGTLMLQYAEHKQKYNCTEFNNLPSLSSKCVIVGKLISGTDDENAYSPVCFLPQYMVQFP